MKLNHIQARGFIGARDIDILAEAPILVVGGDNESGKSSIYEAITLAATGEMARVKLKNEYHEIVSDGAKSGQVLIEFSDGTASFEVPTGKWGEAKALMAPAMRYCLNAHRFAALDDTERRRFLFGLTNTRISKEEISRRLQQRGIADAVIAQAVPMTERGLDAAAKDCAKAATERKGQWREVTAETWGASKGGTWRAELPDFDEDGYQSALADLNSLRAKLDDARTEHGRCQVIAEAARRDQQRKVELRSKIAKKSDLEAEKTKHEDELSFTHADLEKAKADLNELVAQITVEEQQRIARYEPRQTAAGGASAPSEELLSAITPLRGLVETMADYPDGIAYRPKGGPLESYAWDNFPFADQAAEIVRQFDAQHPEYAPGGAHEEPPPDLIDEPPSQEIVAEELLTKRRAAAAEVQKLDSRARDLDTKLRTVAADLGAMEAYQAQLTELELREPDGGSDAALESARAAVDAYAGKVSAAESEVGNLRHVRDSVGRAKAKTSRASGLHSEILNWDACAKALAPDGIPAEIVAEALTPLNTELANIAQQSGWPPVTIDAAMTIRYGGRRYELLAESGKWRADACIAAMIAAVSGTRFIMLDRIDVNSIPNRQKLLRWVGTAVRSGRLDGACLLGTLKAPPTGLPPQLFTTAWLENGKTVAPATATTH